MTGGNEQVKEAGDGEMEGSISCRGLSINRDRLRMVKHCRKVILYYSDRSEV